MAIKKTENKIKTAATAVKTASKLNQMGKAVKKGAKKAAANYAATKPSTTAKAATPKKNYPMTDYMTNPMGLAKDNFLYDVKVANRKADRDQVNAKAKARKFHQEARSNKIQIKKNKLTDIQSEPVKKPKLVDIKTEPSAKSKLVDIKTEPSAKSKLKPILTERGTAKVSKPKKSTSTARKRTTK